MARLVVLGCTVALAAVLPAPGATGQPQPAKKPQAKKGPVKRAKAPRKPRIEKLACRLGTEDQHARIAIELRNGRVNRFAYYSKWKPRTCSMEVERDDAYSTWEDVGDRIVVTLFEDKGAFLIDHLRNRYHFIFREIDRMEYCGMEGKVNGSLTIFRGRPQCLLEGVMVRGEDAMVDEDKPPVPEASETGDATASVERPTP